LVYFIICFAVVLGTHSRTRIQLFVLLNSVQKDKRTAGGYKQGMKTQVDAGKQ